MLVRMDRRTANGEDRVSTSATGVLIVTIEAPPPEWSGDPYSLVSVKGSTHKSDPTLMSDVEWFLEQWSICGEDLFGGVPADGKEHTFRGRLVCTCDYWGEWDLNWVEEENQNDRSSEARGS